MYHYLLIQNALWYHKNYGIAPYCLPNNLPENQNIPTIPMLISRESFRKKSHSKSVTKYNAILEVVPSDLRKIMLQVSFDLNTVKRLQYEISSNTAEMALMIFIVKAKNIRTRMTRTNVFKGAAVQVHRMQFDFTLQLGQKYEFEVEIQKYQPDAGAFSTFLRRSLKYKETLRHAELWELLQRAAVFKQCHCTEDLPVNDAYRNRPRPYFDYIMNKERGIMKVYIKDNNGDKGCPINKQINGLFFGVRIDPRTRSLPKDSYFGNTRIIIPVHIFMEEPLRLYFADFYCHSTMHYVTLVTTKPDSKPDIFCRKHLLELSLENNPFFFRKPCSHSGTSYTTQYQFYCSRVPCVEVLYTEDIDLNKEYIRRQTVTTRGRGSSTEHGIPKRKDCQTCNLYPVISQTDTQQTF